MASARNILVVTRAQVTGGELAVEADGACASTAGRHAVEALHRAAPTTRASSPTRPRTRSSPLTQYRGVARTQASPSSPTATPRKAEAGEGALHRRLRRLQPAPRDRQPLAQHPARLEPGRALAGLRLLPAGRARRLPAPRSSRDAAPTSPAAQGQAFAPVLQPRRQAHRLREQPQREHGRSGWRTPTAAARASSPPARPPTPRPRWSPTGQEIAFTSDRAGTPQIYVMDSEGLNVRRLTTVGNWNDAARLEPVQGVQRDRLHLAPRGGRLRHRGHRPGHPPGPADHRRAAGAASTRPGRRAAATSSSPASAGRRGRSRSPTARAERSDAGRGRRQQRPAGLGP